MQAEDPLSPLEIVYNTAPWENTEHPYSTWDIEELSKRQLNGNFGEPASSVWTPGHLGKEPGNWVGGA